jgi:hypothetical protein
MTRRRTVIIEFENDAPKAKRRAPQRIIHAKGPREYSPRRLSGLINFYDLGQIRSGSSWTDLPFNVKPGVTVNIVNTGSHPPNGDAQFVFSPFTLAHWQQLYDLIFATPFNQWKSHFRKLGFDDGYKYGVSVYQGRGGILSDGFTPNPANQLRETVNPDWTSQGLKPINNWIYVQPTGGLAMAFDTFDTTHFKVTSENAFGAAETTVDVSKGADIFLVPQIGFSSSFQEVGIDADFRRSVLFGEWCVKSRELYLEKTIRRWFNSPFAEVPIFESYFLSDTYKSIGPWMFSTDYVGDAYADQIVAWQKARPHASLYVQRGTNASGGASYNFEPIANFPFAGTGPTSDVNIGMAWTLAADISFGTTTTDGTRDEGAGLLCAIVSTGAGKRYVWRRSSGDNFWPGVGIQTPPES